MISTFLWYAFWMRRQPVFYRHYQDLEEEFRKNRVLIIYGPRRTGKTTLLNRYLTGSGKRYVLEHGENIRFAELITSGDVENIKRFFSEYQIIAIDEAQMIPDMGNALKLLTDHLPDAAVIAAGSSSFNLSQKTGEPLMTGRKRTLVLFPVAQDELTHELASAVGIDAKTVTRYLDLLEKCFVIKQLGPYSGNLRNALMKKRNITFWMRGFVMH